MSTIYAANGSLVTPTVGGGVRKALGGNTNTTPIAMTCTAHGFNTGDTVEQEGVVPAACNGLFQITKVDADHYTLNGTTAPGSAGSASGYAIDYELQPAITLPAGSELADPNVIGAAFECAVNPTPYLYRAAGKYRVVNEYGGVLAVGSAPYISNPWSVNNTFSSGTPVLLANADVTFKSISDAPSGPNPTFQSTDILEIETSFTAKVIPTSGANASYALIGCGVTDGSTLSVAGMPFEVFQAFTVTQGSAPVPACLTTVGAVGLASFTFPLSTLQFALWGMVDSLGSGTTSLSIGLVGNWTAKIRQLRLN